MSKKIKVELEVKDTFKKGDCYNCPFYIREDDYYNEFSEEYVDGAEYCIATRCDEKCPIIEITE